MTCPALPLTIAGLHTHGVHCKDFLTLPCPRPSAACRLTASIEFSPQMMVAAVIGVGLFYMAPHLTSSIVFRLGCGSLLFTLGSLLILVFIIMR